MLNSKTNKIIISDDESKICKLDDKKFNTSREMICYVKKTYNLSFEEYIIKVYYDNVRPTCLKTGKPLSFKPSKLGPWFADYSKNCGPKKSHTDETKRKIKETLKKTCLLKYGETNPFKNKSVKEKIKKTCVDRYGVDNYSKLKLNKNIQLLYETSNKKRADTNIKKYGCPTVFGSSYFKTKSKETILSKYGVDNIMHVEQHRQKVSDKCKEWRKTFIVPTITKPELQFKEFLEFNNIKYEHQKLTDVGRTDFYLSDFDLYIEIDGDYFHKNFDGNYSLINVQNCIYDYNKDKKLNDKLIRIYASNVINIQKFDDILTNSYKRIYNFAFSDKILTKKYLSSIKKESLSKRVNMLLKFVRTFYPQLEVDYESDILSNIMIELSQYDLNRFFDGETFHAKKIKSIGTNFIKNNFHSYWKSSYKGEKSPIELWQDDEFMKKIISYRIGLNKNNEVYDFSIQNLVKGFSANRKTISMFKPLLAKGIYEILLKNIDKDNPIVIDPCMGFGARLIGFKSLYPNGIYIGCEPNIETFNEISYLVNNNQLTNCILYNCKWEDFVLPESYDLIFTSIPYFDLENYSNQIQYNNIETWVDTFLNKFHGLKNCWLNLPKSLEKYVSIGKTFYLNNGSSHFSKSREDKIEYIAEII